MKHNGDDIVIVTITGTTNTKQKQKTRIWLMVIWNTGTEKNMLTLMMILINIYLNLKVQVIWKFKWETNLRDLTGEVAFFGSFWVCLNREAVMIGIDSWYLMPSQTLRSYQGETNHQLTSKSQACCSLTGHFVSEDDGREMKVNELQRQKLQT